MIGFNLSIFWLIVQASPPTVNVGWKLQVRLTWLLVSSGVHFLLLVALSSTKRRACPFLDKSHLVSE